MIEPRGVILAHNLREGESFRRFICGRHKWIIITTRQLAQGITLRGPLTSSLVVVDNPACPDVVMKYHVELVRLFGCAPEVWHVRRSG